MKFLVLELGKLKILTANLRHPFRFSEHFSVCFCGTRMQMLLFLFLKEEDPQLFTKLFLALLGFFKFPRNLQKTRQTIKVSVIKSLCLFTKFQAEHINKQKAILCISMCPWEKPFCWEWCKNPLEVGSLIWLPSIGTSNGWGGMSLLLYTHQHHSPFLKAIKKILNMTQPTAI